MSDSEALLQVDFEAYDKPSSRPSRPTLTQVKALIEFLKNHPGMVHRKLRGSTNPKKMKKLWVEVTNICNSLEGTLKSSEGWIKFWSDKRRNVRLKKQQIDEGTLDSTLTATEEEIYELCHNIPLSAKRCYKKRKRVDQCNGDDDEIKAELFQDTEETEDLGRLSTEAEDRQLGIMEKLVSVMDQQAQAMSQMAQAAHNNSKAIERLAEAAHIQALAVDRLASTFENINGSVLDVRNSIMNIDYTMKSYPSATTQRQNNLFS